MRSTDSEAYSEMGKWMKSAPKPDLKTYALLRRMRFVHRLSGFQLTRPYTDAEHCYYTGLLFEAMADQHNFSVTKREVDWVYVHDSLEVLTGDLLYPAKNLNKATQVAWDIIEHEVTSNSPSLPASDRVAQGFFSDDAWLLFKDCDSLELLMFCIEEARLGNILVNPDGTTVESTMRNLLSKSKFPKIKAIADYDY